MGAGVARQPLDAAAAGHAGAVLGGRRLSSRVPARPALSQREHVDARLARHQRGVLLQPRRHAPAPRLHGPRRDALLRDGGRRDHPRRARALARGARPRPDVGGHPAARGAGSADGACAARRRRGRRADGRGRRRRSRADPTGRARAGGRRNRRGRVGGRRVDADGREPAGGESPRRARRRRQRQSHRIVRVPRHARRRRDHAGAYRSAGRGGAGLARADSAPRGSRGRRLRAGGSPDRRRHVRGLVGIRPIAVRCLRAHERGGRAGHRVPLRDGPGDADRHHGRHGPRRRARRPRQERGGARDARGRGHDGVRQDGHADARPAHADERDPGAGRRRG